MLGFHHDGLEIDSCPECFGLWFDREELRQFLQMPGFIERVASMESQVSVNSQPRHQVRHCPQCRQDLIESTLGEIFVDVCARCRGIWLDQGELSRAVTQYESGQRGNLLVLNQIAEGLRARKERVE